MIVYKFRSGKGLKDDKGNDLFNRDIELLSHDTIYIPTVEQLNDPAEALFDDSMLQAEIGLIKPFVPEDSVNRVNDAVRSLYDKVRYSGIYALTKNPTNELMWAYYASGHCGYAIIFETDVLVKSFDKGNWGGLYEIDVKYSSTLPRFDINKVFTNGVVEALTCLVGTKSKAWEHEAEHRLIFEKGRQCLKIDYRAIKGFVFGCRMDDNSIDRIMKVFSGRNLKYYQTALKGNSYQLQMKQLTDRYPTAEKYCPNNVKYDIDGLLEEDKFIGGVGCKYRAFVESALKEVAREPFVTEIYQMIVSDDNKYPHILIWTYVNQDGSIRPVKSFEFDYIDGDVMPSKTE